jgi:hypothetical protein
MIRKMLIFFQTVVLDAGLRGVAWSGSHAVNSGTDRVIFLALTDLIIS